MSGTNHQTLTTLVNFNGSNGASVWANLTTDAAGNLIRHATAAPAMTALCTSLSGTNHQTLTTLVNFNGSNGANPYYGGLIVDAAGNFYGTDILGAQTITVPFSNCLEQSTRH